MTEYTPTTEEVRHRYCDDTEVEYYQDDEAEFDRWLEQVQAEAWKEGYVAGFLKAMGGELDGSALEAATRVPVQGEPNDDREAMLRRIESFDYGSDRVSDDLEQDIRELVALSRPTVPDASTERERRIESHDHIEDGSRYLDCAKCVIDVARADRDDIEERLSAYLCDSTGGKLSKTGYDVRTMVNHTEEYYEGLHSEARKEVEAERDAALARIAEAAKLHYRRDDLYYRWGDGAVCNACADEDGWESKWPCPTAVALGLDVESEEVQ